MNQNKLPELVLPGGDLHRTKIAFLYGADAVYIGLSEYSLRKAEVKFTISQIEKVIKLAHLQNKKIYVTFNIFAHNKHLKTIELDMIKIADFSPDAFIISDPGIINVAQKATSKVPIHLSTQANALNTEAIKFWQKQGITRIVLGREVTLTEIKEIKRAVPQMEIEVFVHGAMCISYSGRCLASAYLTGRSANLGECAQSCRWEYKVKIPNDKFQMTNKSQNPNSKKIKQNSSLYLEESSRPGEFLELTEDKHGSYLMSSKDLCLIEHSNRLADAGVDAFKIEGRNKTDYYVAVTAKTYRCALNLLKDNKYTKKEKTNLKKELESLTHRGYTTGFLFNDAKKGETFPSRQPILGKRYLGFVKSVKGNWATIVVKNKLEVGEKYEIVTPSEIKQFRIKEMKDKDGKEISIANPGETGKKVEIKTDPLILAKTFIREIKLNI